MARHAVAASGTKGPRLASLAALALGAVVALRASQAFVGAPSALFSAERAAKTARSVKRPKNDMVPGWEPDDSDISFLGNWEDEDKQEEADEEAAEALKAEEMQGDMQLDEDSADGEVLGEETAEEAARKGKMLETFVVAPARSYVSYVAKQNAIRVWRRHERDTSSLEVKIAIATERIRDLVVHLREHRHDHYSRLRLVMLIADRRKMLDKLSWKDVDMYLKVRDTLKIRHVYRIERLIGRLPEYVYTIRDRHKTPGLRTLRRMRKMEERRGRRQKKRPYPLKGFQPKWKTSDREMREMTDYNLNKNTFQEG